MPIRFTWGSGLTGIGRPYSFKTKRLRVRGPPQLPNQQEMDYSKIYKSIIERRLKTPPIAAYVERHHILPRSIGGHNTKSNLVSLTAREHFICHLLLTKIYRAGVKHDKMVRAFVMMLWAKGVGQVRYKVNSTRYEKLKIEFSKIQQERQIGSKNIRFGLRWITNGIENKTINGSESIPDGWRVGRILPSLRKPKTCKRCTNSVVKQRKLCESCWSMIHRRNIDACNSFCVVCNALILQSKAMYCSNNSCKTVKSNRQAEFNKNRKQANKKIICVETEEIFGSLTEAAKKIGCSVSYVSYNLSGKEPHAKGYTFKFLAE